MAEPFLHRTNTEKPKVPGPQKSLEPHIETVDKKAADLLNKGSQVKPADNPKANDAIATQHGRVSNPTRQMQFETTSPSGEKKTITGTEFVGKNNARMVMTPDNHFYKATVAPDGKTLALQPATKEGKIMGPAIEVQRERAGSSDLRNTQAKHEASADSTKPNQSRQEQNPKSADKPATDDNLKRATAEKLERNQQQALASPVDSSKNSEKITHSDRVPATKNDALARDTIPTRSDKSGEQPSSTKNSTKQDLTSLLTDKSTAAKDSPAKHLDAAAGPEPMKDILKNRAYSSSFVAMDSRGINSQANAHSKDSGRDVAANKMTEARMDSKANAGRHDVIDKHEPTTKDLKGDAKSVPLFLPIKDSGKAGGTGGGSGSGRMTDASTKDQLGQRPTDSKAGKGVGAGNSDHISDRKNKQQDSIPTLDPKLKETVGKFQESDKKLLANAIESALKNKPAATDNRALTDATKQMKQVEPKILLALLDWAQGKNNEIKFQDFFPNTQKKLNNIFETIIKNNSNRATGTDQQPTEKAADLSETQKRHADSKDNYSKGSKDPKDKSNDVKTIGEKATSAGSKDTRILSPDTTRQWTAEQVAQTHKAGDQQGLNSDFGTKQNTIISTEDNDNTVKQEQTEKINKNSPQEIITRSSYGMKRPSRPGEASKTDETNKSNSSISSEHTLKRLANDVRILEAGDIEFQDYYIALQTFVKNAWMTVQECRVLPEGAKFVKYFKDGRQPRRHTLNEYKAKEMIENDFIKNGELRAEEFRKGN